MDENKIIKLFNSTDEKTQKPEDKKASRFSLHTNPIQKLFFVNIQNKKDKFKFSDLFR